jgi:D-alanine--poly(phosphoribitol) ligase subunit 1
MPGSEVYLDKGEIVLGGPNVAMGYVNAPASEAARFFQEGGERRYRTGDLGEIGPGGLLHFRGRADTQVKVNGFRVELSEIERALSLVPGVDACCVMLINGEDGAPWIVAFVQTRGESGESELGLRKRLKKALSERLPNYMLPKRFVRVPEMPLNRNGKLDREILRRMM